MRLCPARPLQVSHVVPLAEVLHASSLSADEFLKWVNRRPEFWDEVSGPLDEESSGLVTRFRALMANRPTAAPPDHEPVVPGAEPVSEAATGPQVAANGAPNAQSP